MKYQSGWGVPPEKTTLKKPSLIRIKTRGFKQMHQRFQFQKFSDISNLFPSKIKQKHITLKQFKKTDKLYLRFLIYQELRGK